MASETPYGFESFVDAYIACALWSSMDESDESGGEPMDANYSADDIADETRARMEADCLAFLSQHADDIADGPGGRDGDPYSQAGHDFWLTRNGHGAGFWDGDWEEPAATRLTESSHRFGEYDLTIGDDGKIHGYPA